MRSLAASSGWGQALVWGCEVRIVAGRNCPPVLGTRRSLDRVADLATWPATCSCSCMTDDELELLLLLEELFNLLIGQADSWWPLTN